MNRGSFVAPYEKARAHSILLSEQGKNGSRSSKRTDILNKELIDAVLVPFFNEKWSFIPEYTIACPRGGTFTVDVAAFYEGALRIIFLLKAVETSFNKNNHNYANTSEGETGRIFDHPGRGDNLALIMIDWVPRHVRAPSPRNKKRMEKTKLPNMTAAEERWNDHLRRKHPGAFVAYCKLHFDWDEKTAHAHNIEGCAKLKNALEEITR
tara:strand:- start:1955 stop:2581 length:627 start_codon:yes stop_codon:yes gene_type:complete